MEGCSETNICDVLKDQPGIRSWYKIVLRWRHYTTKFHWHTMLNPTSIVHIISSDLQLARWRLQRRKIVRISILNLAIFAWHEMLNAIWLYPSVFPSCNHIFNLQDGLCKKDNGQNFHTDGLNNQIISTAFIKWLCYRYKSVTLAPWHREQKIQQILYSPQLWMSMLIRSMGHERKQNIHLVWVVW